MSVSSFSVELLSKIGSPLISAIETVDMGGITDQQVAEKLSNMVASVVEMSITLHEKLDLQENESEADATRMALAVLIAPLIGDFYLQNKKLPQADDKNRMIKSLETVLSFSEKYKPASEYASRLSTIGQGQVIFDVTQSKLVVLQNMIEVMRAVSEFSFGQSETKLILDIAERLQNDSEVLAKENETSDKLSELLIFKSLASLYAACHSAEIKKIMGSNQDTPPSLAPVWESYETRVAMMRALVSGAEESPAPEVQKEEPEISNSAVEKPIADSPAPAASGGPMGFFAKKKEGDDAPAAPPPEKEDPPEDKIIENPIEMPEDEIFPRDEGADSSSLPPPPPPSEEKPAGNSGNPMSFFKSPPKKDEEEG